MDIFTKDPKSVETLQKTPEGLKELNAIRTEMLAAVADDIPLLERRGSQVQPFNIKYHREMQIFLAKQERANFEVRNAMIIQEYAKTQTDTTSILDWSQKFFENEMNSIRCAKPNDFTIEPHLIPEANGERALFIKALGEFQKSETTVREKLNKIMKKHGFELEHEIHYMQHPSAEKNIQFRDDMIKSLAFKPEGQIAYNMQPTPMRKPAMMHQAI